MARGRPPKNKTVEDIISDSTEPPMDYKLGDLTPEYVDWYFNNYSKQDFNIKYVKRRNRINPKYFS